MTDEIPPDEHDPIVELIGIYNADGTLGGELRYAFGKLVGRTHCGLCDITHGRLRRRPELDPAIGRVRVPARFVHADETTEAEIDASGGVLPCVLARRRSGRHDIIMGPSQLDACGGDIDAFVESLMSKLRS